MSGLSPKQTATATATARARAPEQAFYRPGQKTRGPLAAAAQKKDDDSKHVALPSAGTASPDRSAPSAAPSAGSPDPSFAISAAPSAVPSATPSSGSPEKKPDTKASWASAVSKTSPPSVASFRKPAASALPLGAPCAALPRLTDYDYALRANWSSSPIEHLSPTLTSLTETYKEDALLTAKDPLFREIIAGIKINPAFHGIYNAGDSAEDNTARIFPLLLILKSVIELSQSPVVLACIMDELICTCGSEDNFKRLLQFIRVTHQSSAQDTANKNKDILNILWSFIKHFSAKDDRLFALFNKASTKDEIPCIRNLPTHSAFETQCAKTLQEAIDRHERLSAKVPRRTRRQFLVTLNPDMSHKDLYAPPDLIVWQIDRTKTRITGMIIDSAGKLTNVREDLTGKRIAFIEIDGPGHFSLINGEMNLASKLRVAIQERFARKHGLYFGRVESKGALRVAPTDSFRPFDFPATIMGQINACATALIESIDRSSSAMLSASSAGAGAGAGSSGTGAGAGSEAVSRPAPLAPLLASPDGSKKRPADTEESESHTPSKQRPRPSPVADEPSPVVATPGISLAFSTASIGSPTAAPSVPIHPAAPPGAQPLVPPWLLAMLAQVSTTPATEPTRHLKAGQAGPGH